MRRSLDQVQTLPGFSVTVERGPRFVPGRRPLQPGGVGSVYVLDDGDAFKIGHTTGYVAARVAALQTGNLRLIRTVATVGPATDAVEAHLHMDFAQWNRRGEWFDRGPVQDVQEEGGWEQLLRSRLPEGDWVITGEP